MMREIHYILFSVQGDELIDRDSLEKVENIMVNVVASQLYFVVESTGGDPFSAVAIMNILQKRFKKITAIIPRHAKSAATLMVLGTDEIYMNDRSSVGPLDLPIEHPSDGSRISALDVQQTITTLSSLSESIAAERYTFLRDDKKVSKKDAAQLALQYATKFVEPIVQQVDPYHLQKANRELRIGLFCAFDLLLSRMMKNRPLDASKTARALVNNYPSHEYAIFAEEAKKTLKLTIKRLEDFKIWEDRLCSEYKKKSKGKENYIEYNIMKLNNVKNAKRKK